MEFLAGDHVFLRVSPTNGVHHFAIKGKLGPIYVGPFEILKKIGTVTYRVALPPALSSVHNIFHISLLRKCVPDPDQIMELQPLCLEKNLTYAEYPINILEVQDKKLQNRPFIFIKYSGVTIQSVKPPRS